jgi:hypothetical protein
VFFEDTYRVTISRLSPRFFSCGMRGRRLEYTFSQLLARKKKLSLNSFPTNGRDSIRKPLPPMRYFERASPTQQLGPRREKGRGQKGGPFFTPSRWGQRGPLLMSA